MPSFGIWGRFCSMSNQPINGFDRVGTIIDLLPFGGQGMINQLPNARSSVGGLAPPD